ncbi:MAG: AAA family ATPase, partial [Sphingomonas sp.]
NRVRDFLRDAQVNYRQFFQAAELELLPRILKRFESLEATLTVDDLKNRISVVRDRNGEINRFGLQSDETELETLSNLLDNPLYHNEQHALTLISSYIEIHENRSEARGLIARRLSLFEQIMDDFLVGKVVSIKSRSGLEILGSTGKLDERELSSGEFHFLFMMVAALLCQRTGTILAIDEPELSLHVKWQRKLVSALSKCSSGASPIFFLATHSTSISAAHAHSVQTLSAID